MTTVKRTILHAAKSTEYSLRDGDTVTCHKPGQVKRNQNAVRKAAIKARCWRIIAAAGYADLEAGTGFCALCGAAGLMLDGLQQSTDATLELGHDVSDEHNGAMCPCNLAIPLHRGCNRMTDSLDLTANFDLYFDPRVNWQDHDTTDQTDYRAQWGPMLWKPRTPEAESLTDTVLTY